MHNYYYNKLHKFCLSSIFLYLPDFEDFYFLHSLFNYTCNIAFYPLKQMNYNISPCGLLKTLLIIFTNLKGIVLGLLSYIFLINHV